MSGGRHVRHVSVGPGLLDSMLSIASLLEPKLHDIWNKNNVRFCFTKITEYFAFSNDEVVHMADLRYL